MSRTNLADDMEIDIVLRLPVKSLVRFKCVSKSWCARFQNPLFITNHYRKQTNNNNNDYANVSVLVLRRDGHYHPRQVNPQDMPFFSLLDHETLSVKENIYLPFYLDNIFGEARVVACNGLICLWYRNHITLWNPATREFKHLHKSHIQRPPNAYRTLIRYCGFGFDSKTDDYKVICIFDNYIDKKITQQVDLYTLSNDSWREIDIPVEYLVYEPPGLSTYINGVFHWASRWGSRGARCSIIAFDMADELFSMLPLPNLSSSYKYWDLGLLNGSLAVFNYPDSEEEMNFDIWVMREYGVTESWTKLLTIGPIFGSYMPLEFWKNGLLFLDSIGDKQLLLYDPITKEIEKLQVHSRSRSISIRMRVVIYVESLVPINGRREHENECFIRLPTQLGGPPSFSKDDPELLKPLVSNDLTQSQVQIKPCGFISLSLPWMACWTISVILGAAALLFILFVLCAVL